MFKKKALPETAIKGIVYQFRYLINDKKASDVKQHAFKSWCQSGLYPRTASLEEEK